MLVFYSACMHFLNKFWYNNDRFAKLGQPYKQLRAKTIQKVFVKVFVNKLLYIYISIVHL